MCWGCAILMFWEISKYASEKECFYSGSTQIMSGNMIWGAEMDCWGNEWLGHVPYLSENGHASKLTGLFKRETKMVRLLLIRVKLTQNVGFHRSPLCDLVTALVELYASQVVLETVFRTLVFTVWVKCWSECWGCAILLFWEISKYTSEKEHLYSRSAF